MKLKVLYLILCLLLVCSFGFPISVGAATPTLSVTEGNVGDGVIVYNLTYSYTYVIKWDGTTIESGTVPSDAQASFDVPKDTGGSHSIKVYCPSSTLVLDTTFTIVPSISLNDTAGNVGDSVTVNGYGFADDEDNIEITYDDDEIATDINANSSGYWSKTIEIPASYAGTHVFDAYGDDTDDSYVANVTFTVEPSISINPSSGNIGTSITVTGAGFEESENGICVTYDNTIVLSGISANSKGSWSSKFSVPSSAGGTHSIDAYGSETDDSDITNLSFSIAPTITIDKDTGHVGDTINIKGTGFSQSETGVTITFDNAALGEAVTADIYGQWSATRIIPACASGIHTIDAYGLSTVASSVKDKSYTVTAQLNISPTSGDVGDSISISGSGFGSSQKIEISYGTIPSVATLTSDAGGNFTGSFKAPGGQSGEIQIVATGGTGISASGIFEMEATAPATPSIKSPKNGDSVGFLGDTRVDFEWVPVTDPSGVTYDLQLSSYNDFQVLLIDHSELTVTTYKSTEAEALPYGEYYWRLRAVDGAGNASDWSETYVVKTGFSTTTIIIIAVVIVVILIIIRALVVFRKK